FDFRRVRRPWPNRCNFAYLDSAKEDLGSRFKSAGIAQIRSIGNGIAAELSVHKIGNGERQNRETSENERPDFCLLCHRCASWRCKYFSKCVATALALAMSSGTRSRKFRTRGSWLTRISS